MMNEKSGDTKKKKNGAHTHARTTVQLGECNIHVGCCLFSHIKANNLRSIIGWFRIALLRNIVRLSIIIFEKRKEKNGAHTNSCTTVRLGERNIHVGCCLFSHNYRNSKTKKKVVSF